MNSDKTNDKYSNLNEDEQAEFSRAFDNGNYAEAYEGSDVRSIVDEMEEAGAGYHKIAGYLLGRFSTYEIREIPDEAFADDVECLRREYASCGFYDL